ncbi:TPA: hypothetical protein L6B10_10320 [Pseudomonas aeruginosa]|nr:hypothetical protein [Pseudomonas aeruginosa]
MIGYQPARSINLLSFKDHIFDESTNEQNTSIDRDQLDIFKEILRFRIHPSKGRIRERRIHNFFKIVKEISRPEFTNEICHLDGVLALRH